MRDRGCLGVALAVLSLVACGGKATKHENASDGRDAGTELGGAGGTAGTSGTSTGGASGSGGLAARREFITSDCWSDDDCESGECRELVPGGYRVCVDPPEEAETCEGDMGFDQCCTSDDCDDGRCMRFIGGYCVGDEVWPHNRCASDECEDAADCANLENGVCFPAGAYSYPVATCVAGGCRLDSDCVEEAGGRCVLNWDPCCDLPRLVCVYPSDGCQTPEDCMPDYCQTLHGCVDGDCQDILTCSIAGCTVTNGRARCSEYGWTCSN